MYAVRASESVVRVYKNFAEYKAFKVTGTIEGITGGRLLGIKAKDSITFYDWDRLEIVRRVDMSQTPKHIIWNEQGTQVVIALEESFYLLQFNADQVEMHLRKLAAGAADDADEDGIEEAFTFIEEFND